MGFKGRRIAGLLLVAGLAGCAKSHPVLPPVPERSGQVLLPPRSAPTAPEHQALIDRVVAVVNDEVITMSELQEAVLLFQREGKAPPPSGEALVELQRKLLDRMVDHRLQVQEARREKIDVTEEDLRGVVDDFVKRNGGDRAKIHDQLRAQGLTWEALRREFRDQILAQRIRARRVTRRANVPEAEVDAYLAENRPKLEAGLRYQARHIAILAEPPDQPTAWERARVEIEAIAQELRSGGEFAELARTRSKDASAASGGDLGWLSRGELEPAFEEPLLRLAKGGVTTPIRSGSAYHLFQLADREELTPDMLAAARAQARDILLQRKAQERLDEWVETLRKKALIAVRL